MNISEAKQMLSKYIRPGYTIVEKKSCECDVVFLRSHKNRVVGAVGIYPDGEPLYPEAIWEAQYWYDNPL